MSGARWNWSCSSAPSATGPVPAPNGSAGRCRGSSHETPYLGSSSRPRRARGGGVVLALWVTAAEPRINWAAYDAIEMRMTERQGEDILGGPPGDYRTGTGQNVGWGSFAPIGATWVL